MWGFAIKSELIVLCKKKKNAINFKYFNNLDAMI